VIGNLVLEFLPPLDLCPESENGDWDLGDLVRDDGYMNGEEKGCPAAPSFLS
jgi:hypothetical protein